MLHDVAEMHLNAGVSNANTLLMAHLEYVERSSFIMIFDLLLSVVNRARFNDDVGVIFIGVITSLFV